MPLSEHEQRLLEEMERNLYRNDADFVAQIGRSGAKPSYRMIVIGVLCALLGIGVLVTGVTIKFALVGILGFLIMFVGVLLMITPPKNSTASSPETQSKASSSSKTRNGFIDRMNERWDKRNHS